MSATDLLPCDYCHRELEAEALTAIRGPGKATLVCATCMASSICGASEADRHRISETWSRVTPQPGLLATATQVTRDTAPPLTPDQIRDGNRRALRAPADTEHSIEYIEVGAWQLDKPIIQARCACGWETERKPADRSVVEAAAEQHLKQSDAAHVYPITVEAQRPGRAD